jgi:predicted phage terminase large subunit-like protein
LTVAARRLDDMTPREVVQLYRVVRNVPATFRDWNELVTPSYNWRWPHVEYLQEKLEQVASGEIMKLMIEMPPRHGKSETATVRYPVYRLTDDPTLRVIIGAYNQTLAEKVSRRARRIASRAGVELSFDRAAAEDWETAQGGGVRAVGVGGGITGQGGDLIIIDDPVKSREEAESETYREKVWEWYTNDLYTRREPGAAMILIMTRWHDDDLAGRILASEDGPNWHVVNLPALAEADDPLGRAPGEALCPARFDEAALRDIRMVLGEYAFAALYQQSPRPREGVMFPRDKATIVHAIPAGAQHIRYWDKAGTEGAGKYTAGVRMAKADGIYYIVHVERKQLASAERRKLMRQTAVTDGVSVKVRMEQEPGSGGKESAEVSVRDLAGFDVKAEPVTGDKATRADPFAAQWQAGNVRLVEGDWNTAYLNELEAFPNGKYSDQTDASSGAFNKLALAFPDRDLNPSHWAKAYA